MNTTVFVGGGRITSALVAGLRRSGHQGVIVVHDRNAEKLRALERDFGIAAEPDLQSAVARADLLIVAVRPAAVAKVLQAIAGCTGASRLLMVSLAAGIPLKQLRPRLGSRVRWARALPSPICRIGRGLTAVTFARNLPRGDRKRVRKFFEQVGPVLEMPESRFDAFNAAYSPGHGYHALATLAKAAQDAGLDGETALTAGAHALAEAIFYWRESGQKLSNLLQEAATPGGTTAATLAAMDAAGYARAIGRGIAAGIRQSRANARR
ncbi:MAG: NAD(P)-binding domain-containing protein [Candidatus Sulfotelmatobacter sp.]